MQEEKENRKRVLTGMRTTGKLHLGHYVGALQEWKRIQDEGSHEAFFLLANVIALTTHAEKPDILDTSVKDAVLDWLSVGLNPFLKNINFVLQSEIPERYELFALLMMVANHAEVMRNPTLKSELSKIDSASMGMMAYPVDEAADVLMVSPTPPRSGDELLVPAGEDQAPLLELARVLVRRFNSRYGATFVEPQGKVGKIGRLVGPDGKEKMGKSLGNAIYLSDSADEIERKVKKMYTDPNRLRASDPGETEKNPVFVYLRAFASDPKDVDQVKQLTEDYQRGGVGDVFVKLTLARILNNFLDPIREERAKVEKTADIKEILIEGNKKTRELSTPLVDSVRKKLHLGYPKR